MASKRGKSDEEAQKRRKLARLRFRQILRSVILNRIWLMDASDQKLSLNVKKNIALLVRTQHKVGLLTLNEKSLLRTHHALRTIEERKKLVKLLAGLTCFARLPPKVRARLVPVVKFMFLTRQRVIIKEGDEPSSIYFVLSGEVEMSKRKFDHLKNMYVDNVEVICGPGDCLGDIEMIENIRRLNTYVSTKDCELLVLHREDFDKVLRPIMTKQWFDKKTSLLAMGYFSYLTEEQLIGACKMGVIRQFEPLETIYYEDKGHVSFVHFVISGECMILQCLKMKVTHKKGKKTFELVDISDTGKDTMFQDMTNQEMLQKLNEGDAKKHRATFDIDNEIESIHNLHADQARRKTTARNMDIKGIEILCGLRKPSVESMYNSSKHEYDGEYDDGEYDEKEDDEDMENIELNDDADTQLDAYNAYVGAEDMRQTYVGEKQEEAAERSSAVKAQRGSLKADQQRSTIRRGGSKKGSKITASVDLPARTSEHSNKSSEAKILVTAMKPTGTKTEETKIENRFIDVGSLFFGGIFGLGEKFEHRVIMARTTVQCLMLPRFWLFEKGKNPGNIWQRRRFYLDTTIPSREILFKDFLTTRKWQKFKKDLIESILDKTSKANPTKVQDIPIICRIVEANDD